MPIELTDEQAAEMSEKIRDLMCHWHPNDQTADYCCEFCGRPAWWSRAMSSQSTDIKARDVFHTEDCDGVRFLKMLEPVETQRFTIGFKNLQMGHNLLGWIDDRDEGRAVVLQRYVKYLEEKGYTVHAWDSTSVTLRGPKTTLP